MLVKQSVCRICLLLFFVYPYKIYKEMFMLSLYIGPSKVNCNNTMTFI